MIKERIVENLRNEFSELRNETFTYIDSGQNNHMFKCSNGWMIRIPKNDFNKDKLVRDIEVLNRLKDILPLEIPQVIHSKIVDQVDSSYMIYECIEGSMFTQSIFNQLETSKDLSKTLAVFLKRLHQGDIVNRLEDLFDQPSILSNWESLSQRFEAKLYPLIKEDDIEEMKDTFNQILISLKDITFKETIVHGDFGPTNIIYDQHHKCIKGIIDFSEMSIGDPAYDIASLMGTFGYGLAFVEDMIPYYPAIESYIKRALLYKKTFALQEALYGVEHEDDAAFEAGIKGYR